MLQKRASEDKIPRGTLSAITKEAEGVLREAARWRSLFGEAGSDELVEMCVLQITALQKKYDYLRRRAGEITDRS